MNLSETTGSVKSRSFGIDLLRIFAAFSVIVLHIMNDGGLLDSTAFGSYQFKVCQVLTAVSYSAVNIYGLISGYVGYRDKDRGFQFTGYLMLWLEVVFYNVVITLYYIWKLPDAVSFRDLLPMFFPLTNNHFWYFTAYSALVLFVPLLNAGIRHCDRNILLPVLAVILLFNPLEAFTGQFITNSGYSFLWLMLLWITGAIMKKYHIGKNIHSFAALAGIAVLDFFIFQLYCQGDGILIGEYFISLDVMDRYTCPLYLLCAIFHLILFDKLKPGPMLQKIIRFAAPASFAVYIANVQKYFWIYGMKGNFSHFAHSSVPGLILRVMASAALFVGAVTIVDYVRRRLFQLLHIRETLDGLITSRYRHTPV